MATAETSQGLTTEITTEITTVEELEALVGTPQQAVRDKVRPSLDPIDRMWLAHSPLCLVGTSDAAGNLDVSPKGDPAGRLAHVVDDRTIVIAERPGNRRVDGYRNILTNPHVGLLFLVPGRGDTLRINGRARLLRDAPYFDELVVKGHRPVLALEVAIEEVFYHCAKAFMRAQLWEPETWDPEALPSTARIAKALVRKDAPLEELERYYGPSYAERLYKA
ncbi:MAG TPA: pyridoxamine 5'-phosphate oxidase family protein [Pseudonocardia sp.]|uniref:pyridoxamine 5'-phosphate oxidase family protein n=1 Tax=Pseudonocardia sp. TaxID=60912 RepID=UPI002B4B8D21|nr:pyridoxamine 5'-phosphate oxidase family protein [Pseudonocardia sp.]HLU59108.1 pyridoxamine 5'-phosphate oxidase family protein [Pseudonocardia sp.]